MKENRKSMIIPMNFPEELVTEILSRLPVRSLLRFKCVCKSWCNRISAKDFTFLHLTNYKPSDLVLAGLADTSDPWKFSIANISPPTRACAEAASTLPFVSRSRIVDYPLPHQFYFGKSCALVPQVCGPCNGIFCLYGKDKERILLWNPLIHDFKIIPQSNLPRHALQGWVFDYTVGFGFDSETNDYKILQIVSNTTAGTYQPQQQFELYSLGTNSWKALDASPLNSFCVRPLFTLYRKIGWLGIKRQIYLFDVSDETLDMIPVSLEGETDSDRRETHLQVFPFRESIAVVICAALPSPCPYFEIWVLNDFTCTQSRSWSKLWTIELENRYWPLGLYGNSYLIFRDSPSLNLMLYDLLNHDVVDVGAAMVRALVYKESLISISGHKRNKNKF